MKNIVVIIVVILVFIGGFWYFTQDRSANILMEDSDHMGELMESDEHMGGEVDMDDMMESEIKEFVVTGSPFEFDVTEIRVNEGDTVRIVFRNAQGTHDWVVDEFGAATEIIQTGEEDTIEFVADQTGTFEYYCSVGNHREMGMVGKLIVE